MQLNNNPKTSFIIQTRDNKGVQQNKKAKREFYIISLWLFFVLLFILTVDIPICFSIDAKFIGMRELISRNIIAIICIIFIVYGFILWCKYKYLFKGTPGLPVKIDNVENINYEHLTFLTTYIIPLICFDFKNIRNFFVLALLLIIIGKIYIETDLFYANPTLALLGYHIYTCETDHEDYANVTFISADKLRDGDAVQYIHLDEKVLFVGRIRN